MRGQSGILYFPLYFPLRAGDWASHCFGLAAACLWTVRTKTRLSFGSRPEAAVTARRRHACGPGTLQPPEGTQLHALRCVLILLGLARLHCIPAWAAGVPKSVSARRSSTTRPSSKAASFEQP